MDDANVPQSCLQVISKCSFAHILCVFWKIRTVSVEIGRIGLGRTLFTNFESNVWKNYTKTVFRSSRNEKPS